MPQPSEWRDQTLYMSKREEPFLLVRTTWWDGRVYAHCTVCYDVCDPNGVTFETDEQLIAHLELHRQHGSFPADGDAAAVAAQANTPLGSVWAPPPTAGELLDEAAEMLGQLKAYGGRVSGWCRDGNSADAHWLEDFDARVRRWKEKVDGRARA